MGELNPEQVILKDLEGNLIELFVVESKDSGGPNRPAMLIVHGHQFPERPGGRTQLSKVLIERLSEAGWIAAAVSQPGYGGSTGPPDCCGPRTQNALRIAFSHLLKLGADPSQSVVWGISRGAMAASCAFVSGSPEPKVIILQAGTYDMESWVDWVNSGALGGDSDLAKAILINQQCEMGQDQQELRDRSGILKVHRGNSDVLIVHGANDRQAPKQDLNDMIRALRSAGRRVECAIAPDKEHRVPPRIALDALAQHWPELAF